MPDISMCRNETCPSRKKCYRFTAEPNPFWQAYAGFAPELNQQACSYFWQVEPTKSKRKPKSK